VLRTATAAAASPNKDWGWARWSELARQLEPGRPPVAQFAEPGRRRSPGVEAILTPSFRAAARCWRGPSGGAARKAGLHHAAAALGTPTIVIFGGFISPRQTGYPHQVNLFTAARLRHAPLRALRAGHAAHRDRRRAGQGADAGRGHCGCGALKARHTA
jgi:hypothetical protein